MVHPNAGCRLPPPVGQAHHLLLHTAAREAACAPTERRRQAAEQCCEVLVKAGADADAMDGCGLTALQWHMLEVTDPLLQQWYLAHAGAALHAGMRCHPQACMSPPATLRPARMCAARFTGAARRGSQTPCSSM
jgi:hypothetical protein